MPGRFLCEGLMPLGRSRRTKREARDVGRAASVVETETVSAPSRGRQALLWLIVLALPVLLLGGAELALRLAGYGQGREPLFVASPQQPTFLQANPSVVRRFFTDPGQAPSVSIETAYFPAQKPPGTFRVFVQGESTTAGFPYGLGAALAGVLDQRLEREYPEREIEVISTAMAAVNSYALVDFADEILTQQPDAVMIYVGHNEFLGILGVGSTMRLASTPALTRAFLAVRDWRLFQLMSRVYARMRPAPAAPQPAAGDSLMARVAGQRSIPLGSETYRRGVAQFEQNLGRLLAKYRAARVPVFIGTVVSNERDQAPLAVLAGAEGEVAGAAKTAYYAAQDSESAGNNDAAREGYAWARDLDPLRFRAPSEFGEVIRRVAAANDATVVDVHAAFAAASEHGLVGDRLLLEHVHPNLDGYFLLADAFRDALVASNLIGPPTNAISEAEARAGMPVTEVDRYFGDYKVALIKSGWPFAPTLTQPTLPPARSEGERLAQELYHQRITWPAAQDALRQHHRAVGDVRGYAHVTGILADAFPFTGALQFEAAAALIEQGRPREALRYSLRSVELQPRDVNSWLVHAHGLLLTGLEPEGRAALEQVLGLEPGNATAKAVLGELAEK
jgi:lysophospholipase L1-like esterase